MLLLPFLKSDDRTTPSCLDHWVKEDSRGASFYSWIADTAIAKETNLENCPDLISFKKTAIAQLQDSFPFPDCQLNDGDLWDCMINILDVAHLAQGNSEELPSIKYKDLKTPDPSTLSELSTSFSLLKGRFIRPAPLYSELYSHICETIEASAVPSVTAKAATTQTAEKVTTAEKDTTGGKQITSEKATENTFLYSYSVYVLGPTTLWLQIGISTELSSLYTNGFKDKKFLKGGFAVLIVVNCGGVIAYFTLASLSGAWIYLAHATVAALNLIWSIVVLIDLARNLALIGGFAFGLLISYHVKLDLPYELLTCGGCMVGYYAVSMIGIGRKFHINKQYLQNMRDAEEETTLIESLFEADGKSGPVGESRYDVQL